MIYAWKPVGRVPWSRVAAARVHAHHAVQPLARAARSALGPGPGDMHTNLGWSAADETFWTHPLAAGIHLGLRVADLTLAVGAPGTDDGATRAGISADDLRLHVTRLASEEMAGRLTGTPGERMAGDYVASAFKALGLEPAGDDGGWFQSFDFSVGAKLGPGNRLAVQTKGGSKTLAPDSDWRPLSFSQDGAIAAATSSSRSCPTASLPARSSPPRTRVCCASRAAS